MTRRRLTTFGEGQVRLTVPAGSPIERADTVSVTVAGSEINVATLLNRLGWQTWWHSVLPRTPLAARIVGDVRASGCTPVVEWVDEGRVALYWLEPGDGAIPASVVYDRDATPIRQVTPDQIRWDDLLETDVVHLTGATAALTEATAECIQEIAARAHTAGIEVVYDVNHRTRLWSAEAAATFVKGIAEHVDLCFCSVRDAHALLGIEESDRLSTARALRAALGIETVVVTDGEKGAACASRTDEAVTQSLVVPIRDRPGAGDAFIAGFLADLGAVPSERLAMGARAAARALSQFGDQTVMTLEDLRANHDGVIRR